MDYRKNYDDYISYVKTLNRKKSDGNYYEKHHIAPKCLGGLDDEENLVLLTGREHFLAHYLLTKIYPESDKLLFAFVGMKRVGKKQKRYVNSVLYENAKKEAAKRKSKRVVCIETCEVFPSAVFVENNIVSGARDVIYGKQITAGGFHWKYENEEAKIKKPYERKKVICANNNMIFENFDEAAKFAKVSPQLVRSICNGNRNGNANGYTFYYYEGKKDYKVKTFTREKRVVCVETGEVFPSLKEAAKNNKSAEVNICNCCKGKQKTYKGFHWKYC